MRGPQMRLKRVLAARLLHSESGHKIETLNAYLFPDKFEHSTPRFLFRMLFKALSSYSFQ
jgi:hypothetical protein